MSSSDSVRLNPYYAVYRKIIDQSERQDSVDITVILDRIDINVLAMALGTMHGITLRKEVDAYEQSLPRD